MICSTPQPNRLLIHKPTCIRLIIPKEVVMQSRLTVGVLVLKPEGLVCDICYLGFDFQTTPAGIVAEPQEVAIFISHLSLDPDLVAVEVVGFLSVFAVFADVVSIGETAYARTTMLYVRIESYIITTACY